LNAKGRSKVGGVARWLPGLIISVVAIWLLISFSNWQDVIQAVSLIKLNWLIPALGLYLISSGFRALSWMVLLQNKAPFGRVFIAMNEGYLLNNIFPFRLGELGRAFLLSQATSLSGFFVLSTIVLERTYDLAIAAGLLLATLPLVIGVDIGQSIAYGVMVVVILGLVAMFIFARNRQQIKSKLFDYSSSRPLFRDRILPSINSILDGLGVLARWDQFLLSFVIMLLSWFFGAMELYFLSRSLGVEAQFLWIAFVLGVISLGIAIPSAPAGLGVYEVAMVGAFSILGVSSSQALAIAIVAHLIQISFTGVIGVYGIFRDGESLAGLYRRLQNIRHLDGFA
jgi:uncharacterized protein (TIRG00374 family)